MFNFTTTTIINSNKDCDLPDGLRFKGDTDRRQFIVARMGTFDVDAIEEVDVANAVEAKNESLKINFGNANLDTNKHYGLKLYIGLSTSSNNSYYANNTWKKGRPFILDFTKDLVSSETNVKNWVDKLDKALAFTYGDGKHLKVTPSGQTITLEAVNEFQRFSKAEIVEYDEDKEYPTTVGYEVKYCYSPVPGEGKDNSEAQKKVFDITPGKEGFGTYKYIISNLRLPTSQHFGAFMVGKDEMPIEGQFYTQITIHYCKQRGNLGMHAVGQSVSSVTTHVFFVKDDIAPTFIGELFAAGLNKSVLFIKANESDSTDKKSHPITKDGDADAITKTTSTDAKAAVQTVKNQTT